MMGSIDNSQHPLLTSESSSKAVCIATIFSFRFLIEAVRFFIAVCSAWRKKLTNLHVKIENMADEKIKKKLTTKKRTDIRSRSVGQPEGKTDRQTDGQPDNSDIKNCVYGKRQNYDHVTLFTLYLLLAVFSFSVKLSSFALASQVRIILHYSHPFAHFFQENINANLSQLNATLNLSI